VARGKVKTLAFNFDVHLTMNGYYNYSPERRILEILYGAKERCWQCEINAGGWPMPVLGAIRLVAVVSEAAEILFFL